MDPEEFANLIEKSCALEIERAEAVLWYKTKYERANYSDVSQIAEFFRQTNLGRPNLTRLTRNLAKSKNTISGKVPRTFGLTREASKNIELLFGVQSTHETILTPLSAKLRAHVQTLKSEQTRAFINETIKCMEHKLFRAAVVLSWVGAASTLQEYVFENHLDTFNKDAVVNRVLKTPAKSIEDMRDVSKESHFLESLARISLIDGSTKKALKECLDRRNVCGHPSELQIGEAYVANHIETLTMNVFTKFSC